MCFVKVENIAPCLYINIKGSQISGNRGVVVVATVQQLVPMHLTVIPAKAGIQSGRYHASWSPGPPPSRGDRKGAQEPSV
jgi:hypothetical protein